nr:ribosome-inactivating protein [Tanacetum cinerariifolium]
LEPAFLLLWGYIGTTLEPALLDAPTTLLIETTLFNTLRTRIVVRKTLDSRDHWICSDRSDHLLSILLALESGMKFRFSPNMFRQIRCSTDRTLCVTSNGHESSDSIFLLKGQGSGDERWTFMVDGTILNPNACLVMDVRNSDVSLKEIILYEPTRNPNKNWLAF